MKSVRKVFVPVIAIAVFGLAATVLYAQQTGKAGGHTAQEALKAMTAHKMTLVSAIETAERETKGQAVNASAQMRDEGAVVSVTCLVGETSKHVTVDVATGKVTETAPMQKAAKNGMNHGKHEQPNKKP